jgi:hypothetical protein
MKDLYRFTMATEIVYGIGASRKIGAIALERGAIRRHDA